MKKIAVMVAVIGAFALIGCQEKAFLTIEGEVSDRYDGYLIYLVPRPNPTPKTVDSVRIAHGRFAFKTAADTMRMCEITLSKRAKAYVQRLLVVVEPGRLQVQIDTVSSAYGTPLNEELQRWKNVMGRAQGTREWVDSTFTLIRRNPNVMGGFIYSTMKSNFDSLQLASLQALGIEKWEVKR
jgi:hypothetical protein